MKSGLLNSGSRPKELTRDRAFEFSCNDLRFGYADGIDILKGVNFTLPKHAMGVIFGRSGVGKTTLLKCITGYISPREGSIDWSPKAPRELGPNEHSVSDLQDRARALITLWNQIENQKTRRPNGIIRRLLYAQSTTSPMVFANSSNALPQLTVAENLSLVLAPICPDLAMREQAITLLLAITDLTETKLQRPQQLSTGQLKRLCLAQSLAINPRLLVWDEPTTGLDSATKYELLSFIQTLRSLVDLPGILVTHDIEAALLMADEIYMFRDGRIEKTVEVNTCQPRRPEDLVNLEYRPLHFELIQFLKSQDSPQISHESENLAALTRE
jgi:phospholipid/cholesterol/gamma-HCH transport system ATP-binding protein